MPNIADLSLEFIILALRIAVIFLLYLFVYQVLRAITRELRTAGTESGVASEYGYAIVVNPGQSGLALGKRFPLNQTNVIGRSMANDIALNDSFLSTEHALLQWDGQTWLIEDLNSTNGTCLNGQEVDGATPLSYGDTIQIGRVELKLAR